MQATKLPYLRLNELYGMGLRRVFSWYVFYLLRLISGNPAHDIVGWTYGFTSNVKHAHGSTKKELVPSKFKSEPSVLACLVFWILSSMEVPDRYELPPVGSQQTYTPHELPCRMYDILGKCEPYCAKAFLPLLSF